MQAGMLKKYLDDNHPMHRLFIVDGVRAYEVSGNLGGTKSREVWLEKNGRVSLFTIII